MTKLQSERAQGWQEIADHLGLSVEGARSRHRNDANLRAIVKRTASKRVWASVVRLSAYMKKRGDA